VIDPTLGVQKGHLGNLKRILSFIVYRINTELSNRVDVTQERLTAHTSLSSMWSPSTTSSFPTAGVTSSPSVSTTTTTTTLVFF